MDVWFLITVLGSPEFWAGFSFILIGLYFLMRGYGKKVRYFRRFLILMLPSLIIALVIASGIKATLVLPRPCTPCPGELCNPYCPEDYAFPSGHATAMFSVFTAAFLTVRDKYRKFIVVGYIVPLLVSLSRIVLGVHTLIDVIGGALIGMFVPVFLFFIIRKYNLVKL